MQRFSWEAAEATLSTGIAVTGAKTIPFCYLVYILWLLAQLLILTLRHPESRWHMWHTVNFCLKLI